jgi:glyoxalase family protein
MTRFIRGLHHVTAISGPPQENVDFYVGLLGQRLVKKTVNFDDPGTYHLYYGDRTGSPGTVMTFFPFADAGPGRAGPGMASAVAYAVSAGGLNAWMERLAERAVEFEGPSERFGERMIALPDPDGLRIELIECATAEADANGASDGTGLAGFHSVSLCLANTERTARLLSDVFGYDDGGEEVDGAGKRLRLCSPSGAIGSAIDLRAQPDRVLERLGIGTIHHIAFRAKNDEEQLAWREKVTSAGMHVTPVIDRQYFNAIYFREPGGVLFEIATDPPGFATDEAEAELGSNLKLPPQYEASRATIERRLPPIRVPT